MNTKWKPDKIIIDGRVLDDPDAKKIVKRCPNTYRNWCWSAASVQAYLGNSCQKIPSNNPIGC